MSREIFYEYSASAVPPDPTVNSPKYTTPLAYATGYYKAIAREGGEFSAVTSTSFGMDVVSDYWKKYLFDGNTNDVKGVENATLSGTTSYITGMNGQALQTGTGGYDYARITMPTGDYTVSLWQLLSGSGTGQPFSIADTLQSTMPNFFINITTNNGLTANYNAYMYGSYTAVQTGYNIKNWNHIVITRTGTNQKMYLNGVLIFNSGNANVQTFLFLGNSFVTYNDLKSFDLVRIYQRALSDSEVAQIYNYEKP